MPFLATSYYSYAKRCFLFFASCRQVADVLFRVHDKALRSNSQAFAKLYLPARIPFGTCVGTDDAPVVIQGVEPPEFDRLLGVIYPPYVTYHIQLSTSKVRRRFHRGSSFFADYGLTEWLMVVDLAIFWDFPAVYALALDHISNMHLSHLVIAYLSESHPLPVSWRLEAIKHFVGRRDPLSIEEARSLGEELTVWIFTAREILGEERRHQEELMEYVIHEIFDITDDDLQ